MKYRAYTYMVRCADGTLYTGWTNDLEKRIKAHNQGLGAKYTRARLPVALVYYEEFESKSEAMKRECAIKKLKREDKLLLIEQIEENTRNCSKRFVEAMRYTNEEENI